jgi:hypothetical protein
MLLPSLTSLTGPSITSIEARCNEIIQQLIVLEKASSEAKEDKDLTATSYIKLCEFKEKIKFLENQVVGVLECRWETQYTQSDSAPLWNSILALYVTLQVHNIDCLHHTLQAGCKDQLTVFVQGWARWCNKTLQQLHDAPTVVVCKDNCSNSKPTGWSKHSQDGTACGSVIAGYWSVWWKGNLQPQFPVLAYPRCIKHIWVSTTYSFPMCQLLQHLRVEHHLFISLLRMFYLWIDYYPRWQGQVFSLPIYWWCSHCWALGWLRLLMC